MNERTYFFSYEWTISFYKCIAHLTLSHVRYNFERLSRKTAVYSRCDIAFIALNTSTIRSHPVVIVNAIMADARGVSLKLTIRCGTMPEIMIDIRNDNSTSTLRRVLYPRLSYHNKRAIIYRYYLSTRYIARIQFTISDTLRPWVIKCL